jgi:hypothetical protein
VHPGAEDRCDGVDQDCDGQDGDPARPTATFVGDDGSTADVSADIVSGMGFTPEAGQLNVCGGEWELNLDLVRDLAIVASGATFSGRVEGRPREEARFNFTGGTWNALIILEAGSVGTLEDLELVSGYANVRDGELTLDRVEMAGGKVYATNSVLTLSNLDVAGDSLMIDASASELHVADVTVSAVVEGNVLRLDQGTATIERLTMTDTAARFAFFSADVTVSDSQFERVNYPLYMASSTTVIEGCSLVDSTGGFQSYGGALEVVDCAFSGTIAAYSVYSTGQATVADSSFTAATNEENRYGYEIVLDADDTEDSLLNEDCRFYESGAGAYQVYTSAPTVIRRSTFEGLQNTAITFGL